MRFSIPALFAVVLITLTAAYAQPKSVSVCSLTRDLQALVGHEVEVSGILHVGDGHYGIIQDASCSVRFASGDDYQTFGNDYPIKRDTQWELMREALAKPVCPHLNTRLAKGKFTGRIVREPRTAMTPQNEMPVELVIQSASEIERVDVQCPVVD